VCLKSNNDSQKNRAAVTASGGASLIALAMDKWSQNPGIQAEGCRVLHNVAVSDNGFKKCMKETGAIDAVLWAMENHPNDVAVQDCSCGALTNISSVKANAEHIVKECNGVKLIVAAMNKFKHNAKVQKWACWALANWLDVCDESEIKDAIVNGGGGRALWDAIENHKDESKEHVKVMQEKARRALKKLL